VLRYHPARTQLRERIDRLADLYARHLVEVTHLIHSSLDRKAQQFADAFKCERIPKWRLPSIPVHPDLAGLRLAAVGQLPAHRLPPAVLERRCFAVMTLNNLFLLLDKIVFPTIDLLPARMISAWWRPAAPAVRPDLRKGVT
jgi:hypothetical protein